MPPKCRLQTGQDAGIKPRGCTFKTDAQGQPLRARTARATGGAADMVTVAKQRPSDPTQKVRRRVRVTYRGTTRVFSDYLLDTGAQSDVLMPKSQFETLLPDKGTHPSKWARFVHENTLPTLRIRGATGSEQRGYKAPVLLEIEVDIGRKGSGSKEFRGGPAEAVIMESGASQSKLIGKSFMKAHHIVVK